MTHAELKVLFIKYHQDIWPHRRCFSNNTGWATYPDGQVIPYGIPAPKRGKLKKAGGGGPDLISLGPENGIMSVWFFEIKTKKDKLRPNQKRFADWCIKNNARYWIVKEDESFADGFDFINLKQH